MIQVAAGAKTGSERIGAAFARARQQKRAALMPYLTLGYPDRATSLRAVAAVAGYSDLLELGVPFSDPLADGPTIQHSSQVALEGGTTSAGCLALVRELRQAGVTTPALLMGYTNPILAYGEGRYVQEAAAAGIDGLIVPDLPPEEAEPLAGLVQDAGMALIYFLAPTSSLARVRLVASRASGFIYIVAVTGVTGARPAVESSLRQLVAQVRRETPLPLAVGFGISTPGQAVAVGQFADGVIVGSALINAMDAATDKVAAAAAFVQELRQALSG